MNTPQSPSVNEPPKKSGKRKLLIGLLVASLLIAGAVYGAYYFLEARF
jgi:membrane fusion protein (multidrug efflux system)